MLIYVCKQEQHIQHNNKKRNGNKMDMFDKAINYLENGEVGDFIFNEENGKKVEIANMCGGRYLCYDNGEVAKQTNNESIAYNFLIK